MREFGYIEGKRAFIGEEIGLKRCVAGVETTVTLAGLRADDKETDERVLGAVEDEMWSVFKDQQPVSPEQIQSVILQRLLQFGTPEEAYLEAIKRR